VRGLLILGILVSGCGRKGTPPEAGGETEEHRVWRGSQGIRQMAAQGPSESIPGTVRVHLPLSRSKTSDDFIELCLDGQVVNRTRLGNTSPGRIVPIEIPVRLRPGVDWLDLWDSTTNRNYRFQVDPRQGRNFVFTPGGEGYERTWEKTD